MGVYTNSNFGTLPSQRGNNDQRIVPIPASRVLCGMLFGQGDRGSITGAVTDSGGAQIPGVAITATHNDTNTQFKTTTTASGEFNLSSLPVGL